MHHYQSASPKIPERQTAINRNLNQIVWEPNNNNHCQKPIIFSGLSPLDPISYIESPQDGA
jgi:hypothetical protein